MALVLVLAVGAQWLGWRLRLPALLFLLVIGFALGALALCGLVFEYYRGHFAL